MKAYEEIADWIASGPTVRDVANYHASASVKEAVRNLLRKEKAAGLMPEEKSELDYYEHLEHIMRLAKARARCRLDDEQLAS